MQRAQERGCQASQPEQPNDPDNESETNEVDRVSLQTAKDLLETLGANELILDIVEGNYSLKSVWYKYHFAKRRGSDVMICKIISIKNMVFDFNCSLFSGIISLTLLQKVCIALLMYRSIRFMIYFLLIHLKTNNDQKCFSGLSTGNSSTIQEQETPDSAVHEDAGNQLDTSHSRNVVCAKFPLLLEMK